MNVLSLQTIVRGRRIFRPDPALDLDPNHAAGDTQQTCVKIAFKWRIYPDLVSCHTWNQNFYSYPYCLITYCLGSKYFFL
jgi:hypothetical protein